MRVEAEPTGRGAAVPNDCRSEVDRGLKGGGLEFELPKTAKRQQTRLSNAGQTYVLAHTYNKNAHTYNKNAGPDLEYLRTL